MNKSLHLYLDAFLAPLSAFLERSDVTDLFVNRPGEVWLMTATGTERHLQPQLDDAGLLRLARQVAAATDQGINREHPLLAAMLPDGSRVQVCAPPATRGNVVIAIRRHHMPDLRLADYQASGAFGHIGQMAAASANVDAHLAALLAAGHINDFLIAAVVAKKTIVIAGGTGTGKTTFLNALLKEMPAGDRLVLIEDTPEIQLPHENAVGLVAVRGKLGEASVTPADLLEAALRLRPDRIIMGEVRGAEAISWLRAVGTGHAGSITTVHANSPESAIEQLALLSMLARIELTRRELLDYIGATLDVIVQLGYQDGKHRITDLRFRPRASNLLSAVPVEGVTLGALQPLPGEPGHVL